MFSSKILTLDKVDIIKILVGTSKTSSRDDYFNLGYPLLNPPTLRGSIVLSLHDNFLQDNCDYFKYGSPIDIGSIKFNFIENAEEIIDLAKCDYEKFTVLINLLKNLHHHHYQTFLKHEPSNETFEIIQRIFDKKVSAIMQESHDPHLWIFEFCLGQGYSIKKHHIKHICIPNTYVNIEPFYSLVKNKEIPTKIYNPKYGIEHAA